MLLFDKNENYISTLKNLITAKHTEVINGEDILEFETLETVEKNQRVAYKNDLGMWKEFIVKEIEKTHTDIIITRAYCESSFYELWGDYVEDKRPTGTATGALSDALLSTRWEVGIVHDLGLNSANFYRISAKEAVQNIAEIWQAEIRTRIIVSGNKITHRYIDLLQHRGGDFGKRFTYTKNLEAVVKTVHRDDVITALYGYGKGEEVGDGFGRRINFADINGGKAYVEDMVALATWGRNQQNGTKAHVFGKVEFDDIEDKALLMALTTEKLSEVSQPLITYECKAIDLGGAELGDEIKVIDAEMDIRLNARVVKAVRDLLNPENNDIVLGNFLPSLSDSLNQQQAFINNFRDKQGVWDRANTFNTDGTLNADYIDGLIEELNDKMNSQGGYVYMSDDGKGIITADGPTLAESTMAIQLVGGGFRIADNKLPNGEFDWRTFGDGTGFTADDIITGILRGGKVLLNLTDGTLIIDDKISYDGTTLDIKVDSIKIGAYDVATVEQINTVSSDLQNQIDTVQNTLSKQSSFIEILPDIPQITLGKSGTSANVTITDETVNIIGSDNASAELSASKLKAPQAEVENLQIGKYIWVHRVANNHMSLKWVGDE